MQEIWDPIQEFPDYHVSSLGRVQNERTGRDLRLTRNQSGIVMAGLFSRGVQYKRSVAILVAKSFLADPHNEYFDTPIHLDGDRENNSADNLAWRPRWFAYQYHSQFKTQYMNRLYEDIEIVETGEVFANSLELAKGLGLIERDVVLATLNDGISVFPTDYNFRLC
jgi:hypothetical protein